MDDLLDSIRPIDGHPIGLVVPHAGYRFSGEIAARGFKQLQGKQYDVAVILAADHQPPVSNPISVWAKGGFETPLGVVPVDESLASALVDSDPRIHSDPNPHLGEHPIEIELPFLQRICPDCRIVPILISSDEDEIVDTLATALVHLLKDQRALIIASSDLSHYPAYDEACTVDRDTLSALETGDPKWIREMIRESKRAGTPNLVTCACSLGPILVTMQASQGLGAETITILGYANSGDVFPASRERVVGYGSVMFWRHVPPTITQVEQETLLRLARDAITSYLQTGNTHIFETSDQNLLRRLGVFVTLRTDGHLRGCTGRLQVNTPLYQTLQEVAISAATNDPRFQPLILEEMGELSIKISILSPLRRITDVGQIEIGRHGLMIVHAGHRGLLLPQVPLEQGWDRKTFLEHVCLKAGLPLTSWTDREAALYVFTTLEFEES